MKLTNLMLLPLALALCACAAIPAKDAKLIEVSGQNVRNRGDIADKSFENTLKESFDFIETSGKGATYVLKVSAYTLCAPSSANIKNPQSEADLAELENSGYILDKSENSISVKLGGAKISNFKTARKHVWSADGVYKPSLKGTGVALAADIPENTTGSFDLKLYLSYFPNVNMALFAPKVAAKNMPVDSDFILSQTVLQYKGEALFMPIFDKMEVSNSSKSFSTPLSYMNANYNDGKTIMRTLIFLTVKKK